MKFKTSILFVVSLITFGNFFSMGAAHADQLTPNGLFFPAPGSTPNDISRSYAPQTCYLNATNVHTSTSTQNNVAADAIVSCKGSSIRITSMRVTLYKNGFPFPHYLTGPNLSGFANSLNTLEYNSFKNPCNNFNLTSYWSVATAYGVYPDGVAANATSTSPVFQLLCGTTSF
jgi:hypothetical protein